MFENNTKIKEIFYVTWCLYSTAKYIDIISNTSSYIIFRYLQHNTEIQQVKYETEATNITF